ncbi:B12-binding domain-containing radical SAM protein [Desulfofundulus sp.]|uniref:B12-binding domain-containing radical SAM protein n=1 Tax=Desulfofundulus sp. TaxID=2282750 RepID=UPI003C77C88C
MKALLVYPRYPESFWSFKYALKFIGVKAAYPPLGLLTVAAMLPPEWEKRLIDLNVKPLTNADLQWADYVFISAMAIQRESVKEIIARCKSLGVKVVAGGPLFTMEPEEYDEVDHLVLNEAEITLPRFLADLEAGKAEHLYTTDQHPDLEQTPVPLWELINMRDYASMSIQYSRGCPYNCEFCDITSLYGRRPRLKNVDQLVMELDALYKRGWRGSVFIVDDNFIGNKVRLKKEVLPVMIEWMQKHKYPFNFITEVSINLADDEELMDMMVNAGFNHVFIGIETPSEESLIECNKFNNVNRNLLASVKKIQNHGMAVSAGFIVGFDSDTPSIFDRQIHFIQQSGIVTAMVGLLNAPKGTRLFERLKRENRLLQGFTGNNTDFSLNFIPKMDPNLLLEGYKKIVTTIYAPTKYYDRILEFFKEFRPKRRINLSMFRLCYLKALFLAMFYLGILEKGRKYYWKLLLKTLLKYPRFLPEAITLAVYGFHFRTIFNKNLSRFDSRPFPDTP